jgi:hypothetical protein
MKLAILLAGVGALALGWIGADPPADEVLVIVGGDVHGYLSPCGCTKPMTGGIRRRGTAVRNMTAGKKALVIENGGLVGNVGRQDELKAETLAEALKFMGADVVHFTSAEAALGRGVADALSRLSGKKLTSASFVNDRRLPIVPFVLAEGFLVAGVSLKAVELARHIDDRPTELVDAVDDVVSQAARKKLPLILMIEGGEADARRVAEMAPSAKLIIYSSTGDPSATPITLGDQTLVSPGEHGKSLLRLRYRQGRFQAYSVVKLTPEFGDDAKVIEVYGRYLSRVREEKLLDKLPRAKGPKFAGNPTCGSCHTGAMLAWEKSRHAGALHTLEIEKHDRDPDCTGCHVVGLESESGFRSRLLTPHLTDVGCESCHGPGAEHSTNPEMFPLPKVGEASCQSCHVKDHSPEFDFASYWKKIEH